LLKVYTKLGRKENTSGKRFAIILDINIKDYRHLFDINLTIMQVSEKT